MPDCASELVWPSSHFREAILALAHARHMNLRVAPMQDGAVFSGIEDCAGALGLEAEPIEALYSQIERLLTQAEGLILHTTVGAKSGFVLILGGARRRLLLLTPDRQWRRVSTRVVRSMLCAPLEEKLSPTLDSLLDALPPARRARAKEALLHTQLGSAPIFVGWLLRSLPSTHFFSQLCGAGLCRQAFQLVCAHALAYGLWIAAWALMGAAALDGRYDPGWWQGWVIMLISLSGLQMLSAWWQTQFLTSASALLKRRLLHGVVRLDQDQVRREGAGQLLGRALEAEAIENLALNGGLSAVLSLFEIAASVLVLVYGAGGGFHGALLLIWLGLATVLAWGYRHHRRVWTRSRLDLTHYLTEQMLGHRTRIVQQPAAQWHTDEDATLSAYHDASTVMDRWAVALTTLVPRGWFIVSLIALTPALLAGSSVPMLAVALGGCLLAYAALRKSTQGLLQLTAADIAWDQVAPLFRAGKAMPEPGAKSNPVTNGNTVFVAQDLVFRHSNQESALLRGIDLCVRRGERILLEGTSGGGKSTLANIITGLRVPDSGLLLLNGLDRYTLRDAWRRQAVNVPQFHDNHILNETLAFNLLMGRCWPPTPADLQEAEALCRALGLGEVIERMPGGLWQVVGENGWRLSHGERSRVYLARALLQPAALMVFDETFAALDPENVARTLDCVVARAPSLIVIAHP